MGHKRRAVGFVSARLPLRCFSCSHEKYTAITFDWFDVDLISLFVLFAHTGRSVSQSAPVLPTRHDHHNNYSQVLFRHSRTVGSMEGMEVNHQQLPAEFRPERPDAKQAPAAPPCHLTNKAEVWSVPGLKNRIDDDELNNREALKHEVDQGNSDCTTDAEGKRKPDCTDGTPPPGFSSVAAEGENLSTHAMNTINNNDGGTAARRLDNHYAASSCNTETVREEGDHVSNVTKASGESAEMERSTGQVDFNENQSTNGDQHRCIIELPRQDSTPDSSGDRIIFSEQQPPYNHNYIEHNPSATGHHQGPVKAEVVDVDELQGGVKPPAQSPTNNRTNELCRSSMQHCDNIANHETDLAAAEKHQCRSMFSLESKGETEGVTFHQNNAADEAVSSAGADKRHDQMEATDGGSINKTSSQEHIPGEEPVLLTQHSNRECSGPEEEKCAGCEASDKNASTGKQNIRGYSPQVNEEQLDSADPTDQDGESVSEGDRREPAAAKHRCDITTPQKEDVTSGITASEQSGNAALDCVATNHDHRYNSTVKTDLETTKPCEGANGNCTPPQQWDRLRAGSSAQGCWKDSDSSDITGDEEDDEEEGEMDPRVSENLEIMNQSCADVNRLENELDEARSQYRATFQASSQRMEELAAKIKKNIQRARPYFELTEQAKEAQNEAFRAARQYQTANGNYRAAKEMITLAEQTFLDKESDNARNLNSAWQETLNHATLRVMESEREKTRSEAEHNKRAAIYAQLEARLQVLEKKFKRSIAKARPYFETKAELELKLQQLKQHIWDLQQTISTRKARYAEALRCLETVSMEIHESRRKRNKMMLKYPREPGVGAESDSITSSISDANIEQNVFSTSSYPDEDDDDLSDEGSDVFSPSSRGHSRENSRGTPPTLSRASSLRQDVKRHRRSVSNGSAASGSVFSSPPGSMPQSPATESVTSQSVSSPNGFSCVSGFAAASKFSGGEGEIHKPSSDSPAPSSFCDQQSPLPTTLLSLAQGEGREYAHSSPSSSADLRPAASVESEERNAQSQHLLRSSAGETTAVRDDDERVAGDGSSCEDCPQGEQQSKGSRSDNAVPSHHSPKSSDKSCSPGLRSSSPGRRPRTGSDSEMLLLNKSSSVPKGLDGGKDLSISPLAATPQSSPAASQTVQGAPVSLVKAGGSGMEVKKQPLRKAKPLQGFFVLNPSDLASSCSSPSLRF